MNGDFPMLNLREPYIVRVAGFSQGHRTKNAQRKVQAVIAVPY